MQTRFRKTCRRWLPPEVLRARRIALRLPDVIGRTVVTARRHAVRRRRGRPHTLLLHPFRPHIEDDYTITLIACRLGLRLTTDTRVVSAAAMHWHDTTRRPPDVFLERLAQAMHVINLHGNDISKTRIDTTMQETFGYRLAVDPLRTTGPMLEKSDLNALHDGRIIAGPLAAPEAGRVYQRLVRGTRSGDVVEELRIPIVGHHVPFVHLKYKRAENPLTLSIRGAIADTDAVLSREEHDGLIRFSHALGIDFGELDAMRDRVDGRIYVFDANNTPCVRFVGVSPSDRGATVDRLAAAFESTYLR